MGDGSMRVLRLPGVYPPQRDTWLLAEVLSQELLTPTTRVLDICAGTGAVGLTACRAGALQVTAVDVSRRALVNAWINSRLHRQALRLRRGDLIEPVRTELFDVIVSNPPYVPASSDRLPTGGAARAWDAGRDGRAVLDRICVQAPEVLAAGGSLFIVQSALSGVEKTIAMLEEQGLRAEVVRRIEHPFGPVLFGRRAMLVARGVIRPDQCAEEIVVIKALRSRSQSCGRAGSLDELPRVTVTAGACANCCCTCTGVCRTCANTDTRTGFFGLVHSDASSKPTRRPWPDGASTATRGTGFRPPPAEPGRSVAPDNLET